MTDKPKNSPAKPQSKAKKDRLANALRENLTRRKAPAAKDKK